MVVRCVKIPRAKMADLDLKVGVREAGVTAWKERRKKENMA